MNVMIGANDETFEYRPDAFNEIRGTEDKSGMVAGFAFISKEGINSLIAPRTTIPSLRAFDVTRTTPRTEGSLTKGGFADDLNKLGF